MNDRESPHGAANEHVADTRQLPPGAATAAAVAPQDDEGQEATAQQQAIQPGDAPGQIEPELDQPELESAAGDEDRDTQAAKPKPPVAARKADAREPNAPTEPTDKARPATEAVVPSRVAEVAAGPSEDVTGTATAEVQKSDHGSGKEKSQQGEKKKSVRAAAVGPVNAPGADKPEVSAAVPKQLPQATDPTARGRPTTRLTHRPRAQTRAPPTARVLHR